MTNLTADRIFQGSTLVNISPTDDTSSVTQSGVSEVQGWGFDIVSGASARETRHAVRIVLIKANESLGEGFTERAFTGAEIFNGRKVVGPFDRIRIEWTKTSDFAAHVPPPITLRVYKFPNRVGVMDSSEGEGSTVIDVMSGLTTTNVAAQSWLGFYDDDTPAPEGLSHNAENMTVGEGLGTDTRNGPHKSIKRRLYCTVAVVTAETGHTLSLHARQNGGPAWVPIDSFTSTTHTGPAFTTQVMTVGAEGILVPSSIQLWLHNNAAAASLSFYVWSWFGPV